MTPHYASIFLLSVFQVTLHPATSQQNTTPPPCQDVALIDCTQPGFCDDNEFASLLCPKTCRLCTDVVVDCNKVESSLCASNAQEVCSDPDLAALLCPVTCGLCGPASTMPPSTTTPGVSTTASTMPPPSTTTPAAVNTTEWPHFCPTCVDATHTRDCLTSVETCKGAQVCKGVVRNWKLSMMCASPLICEFDEIQSPRNCSSGEAFGPQDECVFCCSGSECMGHIRQVQYGLDNIPLVLHCPTCKNETDPRVCAERVVPCGPHHTSSAGGTVCRVTNDNGVFSAGCDIGTECEQAAPGPTCQSSGSGQCTYCCHGSSCLTNALGGVGLTIAPDMTTAPGQTTAKPCVDADFYPCDYAQDVACSDEDMATTVCPVTCGRCPGSN